MRKLKPITPGELLREEFLKPLGITRLDMPATADRVWHAIHAAR